MTSLPVGVAMVIGLMAGTALTVIGGAVGLAFFLRSMAQKKGEAEASPINPR